MKKVYCLLTNWTCDGESGANVEVFETHENAHEAFLATVEEERREDHIYNNENVIEDFSEEGETFCVYEEGFFSEDNFQMSVVEREVRKTEKSIIRFHSEMNIWMDAMIECKSEDVKAVEKAIEDGIDRFYGSDDAGGYLDEVEFALSERKIDYKLFYDSCAEEETSDEYNQTVKKMADKYGENFINYVI